MVQAPQHLPITDLQEFAPESQSIGSRREFRSDIRSLSLEAVLLALEESRAPAERLTIASLRDGRLRVVEAIDIDVERADGTVTASIQEIDEYGQGASLAEAVEDLQRSLAELFLTLDEDRDALGPDLQRALAWLRQRIVREPS